MRVFTNNSRPPTCFFCLTALNSHPRNPRSFKCSSCLCWNRYDESGQIISDEPAMREESFNVSSFAKRASPSKHRLPTTYGKGPFCHTCLTNQTLLVNLLSNYLPSPDDPSYEARLNELPTYTTSLQSRYPPVCSDCQPSVDEELRKKDRMARTAALGGWLKQTQNVGRQRSTDHRRGKHEMLLWKLRGVLCVLTFVIFVSTDMAGVLRYDLRRSWLALTLPVLVPISLLWTFWDPTWSSMKASQLHGRAFGVLGRERYLRCQMIIWLSRLVTSVWIVLDYRVAHFITPYRSRCWFSVALSTEVVLAIFSLSGIRIQRPAKVRLLEPRSIRSESPHDSRMPTSGTRREKVLPNFSSAHTSSISTEPIFGQPSFPLPVSDIPEEDLMDWTPIHPQGATTERVQDREGWMRPQRFFPPEQPTGLEDLFEKAKLDTEDNAGKQDQPQQEQQEEDDAFRELSSFFAAAVAIALIAGLGVYRF